MPEQAGKRESAQTVLGGVEGKRSLPHREHVAGLIRAEFIQGRLQAHYHTVLAEHQLVRSHPATASAEDLVVRSAYQSAAVLQHEADTVAHSLGHGLDLPR